MKPIPPQGKSSHPMNVNVGSFLLGSIKALDAFFLQKQLDPLNLPTVNNKQKQQQKKHSTEFV